MTLLIHPIMLMPGWSNVPLQHLQCISIQSSTSYVFTVSRAALELDTDYTSIKRLLWGPPQRHIASTSNLSTLYLSSTCPPQTGVVLYYLKPSSRSTALNTRVTSYSSHPILLSATMVLPVGSVARLCTNTLPQQWHTGQQMESV